MRIKTVVRYSILVWLATILVNAHLIGVSLLQGWSRGEALRELGGAILVIVSGEWCWIWLAAWGYFGAHMPFLPLLQAGLLLLGLVIWLRRPNLLTATILALLGMCAGPVGYCVFGYPEMALPIAAIVFLVGFLLHCIWRRYAASRAETRPRQNTSHHSA